MEKNIKVIINELNKIKEKSINKENGFSVISIDETKEIAQRCHLSPIEVEIAALKEEIMPERYQRNYNTISYSEQIKLLHSRVAIIGCGGLGGSIVELLARLGIGKLTLVDGDVFSENNLNRQLLCSEENISRGKAEAAAERIKQINPNIRTRTYSRFIDSVNIHEIIQETDLAVDALDNISDRFVLEKACQKERIPFIHGAVEGLNGQVSTIFPQDKGLELIYGSSKKYNKQKKGSRISVLSPTPALIASFQVQEVIKVLLKRGTILRKKLLFINLEDLDINILELE